MLRLLPQTRQKQNDHDISAGATNISLGINGVAASRDVRYALDQ